MSADVCVVVPAAEEESTIAACLESILVAADTVTIAAGIAVQVVVVLDGCTDRTADVVTRFPAITAVQAGQRNVGHARRLGAAHGLRTLSVAGLLASTDSDSIVPPDWLVVLHALSATADMILGTVVPDVGLAGDIEREWYSRHDLRDGHPYVHGANLAICARAYRAIGGWAPLASHEDVDLADRAVGAGLRVLRTAQVPVRTSTRAVGRTPHGFSSYLRELGHHSDPSGTTTLPPDASVSNLR